MREVEKVKRFKEMVKSRYLKACVVVGALCSALMVSAFAVEGDASDTVITSFQTGLQSVASDALKLIAVIVPIAIGVAGVVFLARKAMGWFKSLAK